jgi:hypothetical protein
MIFCSYQEFDGDWFWWENLIAAGKNLSRFGVLQFPI